MCRIRVRVRVLPQRSLRAKHLSSKGLQGGLRGVQAIRACSPTLCLEGPLGRWGLLPVDGRRSSGHRLNASGVNGSRPPAPTAPRDRRREQRTEHRKQTPTSRDNKGSTTRRGQDPGWRRGGPPRRSQSRGESGTSEGSAPGRLAIGHRSRPLFGHGINRATSTFKIRAEEKPL